MTVLTLTIRSQNDTAQSITAALNTPDARIGITRLSNMVAGFLNGSQPGRIEADLDSIDTPAFPFNGAASGPTTTVTITSDEPYADVRDRLIKPAQPTESQIFGNALITYFAALAGGSKQAVVAVANTAGGLSRTWYFGKAAA